MRRTRGIAGAAGAVAIGLVLSAAPAQAADPSLMPWPRSVAVQAGALPLEGDFVVAWRGHRARELDQAVARFQADMRRRAGHLGGAGPRLEIEVAGPDPGALTPKAREAYRLEVGAQGVRLVAEGPVGVLRGLATLRQLARTGADGVELPHARIDDAPRFAWRGLLIDPARHFVRVETLKRQIDAMERTKLNVLHLHLSDNEGFRVESRRYPKLTAVAGHGEYYTQAEIRGLVAYAADRGVRIVPEFDVPGHVGALLSAYPELSASPVDPANRIGLMSLALDPTKPATYAFLEGLFSEMAALFPDPYFHVGGDEVTASAWTGNPAIAAAMARDGLDVHGLQARFFRKVHEIVRRQGKVTVAWEETAAQPVDDAVLLQAWRSSQALAPITAQGNPAILSAGYYLDLLWPGLDHYGRDPLDLGATPPDRAENALGPPAKGPLTSQQARLVLGAEAALWSEVVTDEMVDGRLWPRAALLAERFWSPADVRDPASANRRLVSVQQDLRLGGVRDAEIRRQMSARLAPEDAEAVDRLASATGPVRNFGRLWDVIDAVRHGRRPEAPRLNTLADAAAPDSLEVHRLSADVDAYLGGDRSPGARIRAQLQAYRDNHPRYVLAARGHSGLEEAVPVSADLAALAEGGLQALDILENVREPAAGWDTTIQGVLQRQAEAEAASASSQMIWNGAPQPPAKLLIIASPPIRRLIEAAGR